MSRRKDKTNVFDRIAVLKTTLELEKQGLNHKVDLLGGLESAKLKNKNDSFSFVIDILTLLVGSDSIRKSVTKVISQIKTVDKDFKETLKKELTSNIDDTTPISSKILLGMKTSIKNIDTLSLLSIDKDSDQGKLLLGDSTKPISKLHSIVRDNTSGFKELNKSLLVSYDSSTGNISFKPNTNNTSLKSYINDYIDNVILLDEKELVKVVLASLFSLKTSKSKENSLVDEKINSIIDKISKNEDPDTYFKFDINNLLSEELRSDNLNRLITEIGCGRTATSISASEINDIVGSENNQFNEEIISKTLSTVANTLISNNDTKVVNPADRQSIKNNFFDKLMKELKLVIVKSFVFNPEIQLALLMIDVSKNKDILNVSDPITQINKRKKTITCIINRLMSSIIKILYELLKKEILALISNVITIYAKESIDKYKKLLKSVVKPK